MPRFKEGEELWVRATFVCYADGYANACVIIDGEEFFFNVSEFLADHNGNAAACENDGGET